MASRKTIILLGIFLVLFAYVYFFEIQGEKRKQSRLEKQELVLNIDKDRVVELRFLPAQIHVKKQQNQWKIVAPVQADADLSLIDDLLDSFSRLKRGRLVSDNRNDFKKFGLDPYLSALVVTSRDQTSDTLFLGDPNLDSTRVFFRRSGSNKVFLVATSLKNHVASSLYQLRDKSVLRFKADQIQQVIIRKHNKRFNCVKDSSQQWWLEQPIQALADEDKIDDMLTRLQSSKVTRFEAETANKLQRYGLDDPWLTVSLFDSSRKNPKTLAIGSKNGDQYHARDSSRPAVFLVDSSPCGTKPWFALTRTR